MVFAIVTLLVNVATLVVEILALFRGGEPVLKRTSNGPPEPTSPTNRVALNVMLGGTVVLSIAAVLYLLAAKHIDSTCGQAAYHLQHNDADWGRGLSALSFFAGIVACVLWERGNVPRGFALAIILVLLAAVLFIYFYNLPVYNMVEPGTCG
jgi:hypothetical protein